MLNLEKINAKVADIETKMVNNLSFMSNQTFSKFLNRGIFTPAGILIIVSTVVIAGTGILSYKCGLFKMNEEEVKILEENIVTDIEKYLDPNVKLYGVSMPPKTEYQAISSEEAILFVVKHLESKGVENIKIHHLLWSVAPSGEFYIAGGCSFSKGNKENLKFLASLSDSSKKDIERPVFLLFKSEKIWYTSLDPEIIYKPGSDFSWIGEQFVRYESMAESYNVPSVFKVVETQDETADWKTYTSPKMGFSISYPSDWSIDEETALPTGIKIRIQKNNDARVGIQSGIRYNQDLGRNYYLDEWIQIVRDSMIRFHDPDYTEKSIELAGQEATEFIFETNMFPQPPYLYRKICTGGGGKTDTIFEIVTNFDSTKENIYGPIIDQMLSTFRFVETQDETAEQLKEIKNAEYYSSVYKKNIRLKDGKYYEEPDPMITSFGTEVSVEKIATGDLDNDGKKDAAVILRNYYTGGSIARYDLSILKNKNGEFDYLTHIYLGYGVKINSIDIQSGEIVLDMLIHDSDDPIFYPTVSKVFRYKL